MDNDPDPYGQAALMLCEGLMLLLIETGQVRTDRLVDMVEGIIEVKQEIAGVSESVVVSLRSISLLQVMARSLSAAADPKLLGAA